MPPSRSRSASGTGSAGPRWPPPRPTSSSGKHVYKGFLVDEQDPTSYTSDVKIYVYHNSFSGGGWAIDMGSSNRRIPNLFVLNNIFSTYGLASSGGTAQGKVASNWIRHNPHGYPDIEEGNVFGDNTRLWNDEVVPDFQIPNTPYGQTAQTGTLDLSQSFTVEGVNYPALPGMDHHIPFFGVELETEEPPVALDKNVTVLIKNVPAGDHKVRVQLLRASDDFVEDSADSAIFTVPADPVPPLNVETPVVA